MLIDMVDSKVALEEDHRLIVLLNHLILRGGTHENLVQVVQSACLLLYFTKRLVKLILDIVRASRKLLLKGVLVKFRASNFLRIELHMVRLPLNDTLSVALEDLVRSSGINHVVNFKSMGDIKMLHEFFGPQVVSFYDKNEVILVYYVQHHVSLVADVADIRPLKDKT